MMDVKTYIKMVLKKKNMTRAEFVRRINVVKRELGDTTRFREPNLVEIFKTDRALEERTILIFEAALGLPIDSINKFNKDSATYSYRKANKELREVIKNAKFNF